MEDQAVRMRLLWAQGLERPPVVILLDPSLFLSENHPSVEEEGGPGMLRAGNHAPEVGGTRKTGQCWVTSSCPSVLSPSFQERQRDTLTETAARIHDRGQEGGTENRGRHGKGEPQGQIDQG